MKKQIQFIPDDNNYNLELHMAVLKACGLKLDFDEVYEDYQKIYDKTMEMLGDKKKIRYAGRKKEETIKE